MKQKHSPDMWAALYAAGALTPEERRYFEASLDTERNHREELHQLDEVICALAEGAGIGTPSPEIREKLLQKVLHTRPGRDTDTEMDHSESGADQAPASFSPERVSNKIKIALAADAVWEKTGWAGVSRRTLFHDPETGQFSALLKLNAGASFPPHRHDGPEECLILEGELDVDGKRLGPGDFQYHPVGSRHSRQHSPSGCVAFVSGVQLSHASH